MLPGEGVGLLFEDGKSAIQGEDGHVVLAWHISASDQGCQIPIRTDSENTIFALFLT